MKVLLILISVLLLTPIAYSLPEIVCENIPYSSEMNSYSKGCFILYYKESNSHVALCEKFYLTNPKYIRRCYIIAEDGTKIPIEFSENCQNPILYTYLHENSHIDLESGSHTICLSKKFEKVIGVSNNFGTLLFNYKSLKNSHINIGNNAKYLYIKNYGNPTTKMYPKNRSYLSFLVIRFMDQDSIPLYKCFYRYGNESWMSNWIERPCGIYTATIDFKSPKVFVESKVINLAGKVAKTINVYYPFIKHIRISVKIPKTHVMSIDEGFVEIPIEIKNIGTFPLKDLILTYNVTGKYYLETDCETEIEVINPGDSYKCTLKFFPAKTGTYKISILVKGFVKTPYKIIPEDSSVSIYIDVRPTKGITIVADPSFILPIIILLLSMYLIVR